MLHDVANNYFPFLKCEQKIIFLSHECPIMFLKTTVSTGNYYLIYYFIPQYLSIKQNLNYLSSTFLKSK